MAMSESDIQQGWIYQTSNQQQRLVLGWDRDGRVVYCSKGKSLDGPFQNCHVRITTRKFAQRAIGKLREVEDLESYIVANKATTVVVRKAPTAADRRRSSSAPTPPIDPAPDT